jgi:hypothetical protein
MTNSLVRMPTYDHLDYRPLTAPVTSAQVATFKRWAKSTGQVWAQPTAASVIGWVLGGFAIVIFVFVGGFLIGGVIVRAILLSLGVSGWVAPFVSTAIVTLVFVAIGVLIVLAMIRGSSAAWTKHYRLDQFARANGLAAFPVSADPHYAGSIFGVGSSRASYDRIQSTSGRFLDIGSYRYTTGSGKNRTTHTWGYLAMQLDRRLPQMVLDSKANNGLFGSTNLPKTFSRDQVLSLEGDFDKYFTLYCPREYERDALYIFTPDLMALLIDNAGAFDVEIVDDWLFVYSSTPIDTTDPAQIGRMFQIVDTVGAKTITQSDRYSDERVADAGASHDQAAALAGPDASRNLIAPQGRRLRTRFSWVSIVVFAFIIVVWFVVPMLSR